MILGQRIFREGPEIDMPVELNDAQLAAIRKLRNGSILCGGVGTGKSRTALAYYFIQNGGIISGIQEGGAFNPAYKKYRRMVKKPMDLYIITTARKRDTLEWEAEMPAFEMLPETSSYEHKIVVDSWNNIHKYVGVTDSFFIFDEQRVVGKGVWAKSFRKIAKYNQWILLSATPGDTWMDYMQVFIANGFFRNQREFLEQHVVFSPRVKFPKVERYTNTGRLIRLRDRILVDIEYLKKTEAHHEDVIVNYDRDAYKKLIRSRWNPWTNSPIENAAELCYCLRKMVNSDRSRQDALLDIFAKHRKLIVFYNHDYERDILLHLNYGDGVEVAEWNGHKHQPIPKNQTWVYIVQYTAGAEGWNCIETDTIVFYSMTYSYKTLEQACGRIDRMNTPFKDLYYYHLASKASIDLMIGKALKTKKQFNETRFVSRLK